MGWGASRLVPWTIFPMGGRVDLAVIYQDLLRQGELAGFEVFQRFYEIGSPQGLAETRRYFEMKESQQ